MKAIHDLFHSINNESFYYKQFEQEKDFNILFVRPTLSGKHLYQFLIPYYCLLDSEFINVAITGGIKKFDPNTRFKLDLKPEELGEDEIKWADLIVFPFCNQSLTMVFDKIRKVNENASIGFWVDTNFYHDGKFQSEVLFVEENMLNSDLIIVSNKLLMSGLQNSLSHRVEANPKIKETKASMMVFPYLTDPEIVLDNIDFDLESTTMRVSKEGNESNEIESTEEKLSIKAERKKGANEVAKKNSKKEVVKKGSGSDKKVVTQKAETKRGGSSVKNAISSKGKSSAYKKTTYKNSKPTATKVDIGSNTTHALLDDKFQKNPHSVSNTERKRIGVFYSPDRKEDFLHFLPDIVTFKNRFHSSVDIFVIGAREEDTEEWKRVIPSTFEFELVKPVSIVHWHKLIASLSLDLMVIPLMSTDYNAQTEDYNKFLEFSLLQVPLLAPEVGQYIQLITDKNGYKYDPKLTGDSNVGEMSLLSKLCFMADLVKAEDMAKRGQISNQMVTKMFSYNRNNLAFIESLILPIE